MKVMCCMEEGGKQAWEREDQLCVSPKLRALLVEQYSWETGNAETRGNTGFLLLKKHKIHLNSSVLPSVLNHLENISLAGTIVISVMLDLIPFWLHFYCLLLVFTVGFGGFFVGFFLVVGCCFGDFFSPWSL